MSYVLSVIHPPVAPATFGRAVVSVPVLSHALAAEFAVKPLMDAGLTYDEATHFASTVWLDSEHPGAVLTHEATGLSFRIDPTDNAPHPCPCCGRLVVPSDHAYAHDPDAYCLGCYTWDRNTEGCLPANTAHTVEIA
jgi:hypothetical protein